MITRRSLAGLAALSIGARAVAAPAVSLTSDEVRAALSARINKGHGVGMVVGLVTAQERRVIGSGLRAKDHTSEVDGDTEFEIGSITKLFTGLLLEDMVRRGDVKLDEPIDDLLPTGHKAPRWGNSELRS